MKPTIATQMILAVLVVAAVAVGAAAAAAVAVQEQASPLPSSNSTEQDSVVALPAVSDPNSPLYSVAETEHAIGIENEVEREQATATAL